MHCHAAPLGGGGFATFPLANGSTVRVRRRERHFVLLGPDRQPRWLYNGVAGEDYVKQTGHDRTSSAAQPFNTG